MAKKTSREVNIEYKLINSQFNASIKGIQSEITSLTKSFKLQSEQMKLTGSESEKLGATLNHLKQKQALQKEKTEEIRKALENAKKTMGENSTEAKKWANQLVDSQKAEAVLGNQISLTNQKLAEAQKAESAAAKASQERKEKLKELASEQDKVTSKMDALTAKYNAQVTALGNNASESDKLKVKQAYLKEAMATTKQEVKGLEESLKIAKQEFGANSVEVNKLEKELAEATTKAKAFENEYANVGNTAKKVSDKLTTTGKAISNIGDSYSKRVSLPLLAGIGATVKVASDLETAFTGVRKTVDEVRDKNGKLVISYKDLENGIIEMSKTMPTSAVEIAGVVEAAGQLGVKANDVLSFSKTMVQMGEATNLSATDAATSIARFTNIMGGSLGQVNRLGSAIVYLGNNYATTESEITAMAMRLAGSGHQIGLTQQNVLALATAMSSLGIEAEAGGSSMSKVMTKMQNAVMGPQEAFKGFQEELSKVGLTYHDVKLAVESGGKALEEMANKTGYTKSGLKDLVKEFDTGQSKIELFAQVAGMSSEQFAKIFKEKPIEAINAFVKGLGEMSKRGENVNTVLNDLGITELRETDTLKRLSGGQDILSNAIKDANKAWDKNNALTNEAQKKNDTFAGKMSMLKNEVIAFMNDAGRPIADALKTMFEHLKPVLEAIGRLAKKFNEASPETQKLVMVIGLVVIAIGPLLSIVGRLITGLGTLTGAWATAFGGAEAVTPAVKGLSMVLKGLSKIAGPILTVFKSLFTGLGGVFARLLPMVSGAFQAVAAFIIANPIALAIAAAVAALIFIWVKWGDDIKAFFKKHWEETKKIFADGWKAISDFLTNIWKGFVEGAKAIWEGLKNVFKFLWEAIKEIFNIGWIAVSTPITLAMNTFVAGVKAIWEPLSQFFKGMWDGIKEVATSTWQAISDFTNAIWTPISEFLKGIWQGICDLAKSIFGGIKDAISGYFNFIKDSIVMPVWNSITGFLSGIWNGIKSKATEIFGNIKSFLGTTWDNIKSATSSTWENIKTNLGQHWDNIKTSASNKFTSIKQNITTVWNAVKVVSGGVWEQVKQTVSGKIDGIKSKVRSGLDAISGFFKSCRLKLPHIDLPHFSIDGEFSLNPPSVPHLSVDWYKTGGIAKSASIVGIGEAGKEAVVPLEGRYMQPFAQAIADRMNFENSNGGVINIVLNQDIKETADFRKGMDIVDRELRRRGFKLNYGTGVV